MRFDLGEKVRVKHQPDLGVCVVTDPFEPTDARIYQSGRLVEVGFYVRIKAGSKHGLGYHEENLEAA